MWPRAGPAPAAGGAVTSLALTRKRLGRRTECGTARPQATRPRGRSRSGGRGLGPQNRGRLRPCLCHPFQQRLFFCPSDSKIVRALTGELFDLEAELPALWFSDNPSASRVSAVLVEWREEKTLQGDEAINHARTFRKASKAGPRFRTWGLGVAPRLRPRTALELSRVWLTRGVGYRY